MVPPRAYHQSRVFRRRQDGAVVSRADRITRALHVGGIGGAPAEKVRHHERAEAPALGVEARAGAGGVEAKLVRGAGVQHEEVRHQAIGPLAPEQVAPLPAARELRARFREPHHMLLRRAATSTEGVAAIRTSASAASPKATASKQRITGSVRKRLLAP